MQISLCHPWNAGDSYHLSTIRGLCPLTGRLTPPRRARLEWTELKEREGRAGGLEVKQVF